MERGLRDLWYRAKQMLGLSVADDIDTNKYLQWGKRWAGCCYEAFHLPGAKPHIGTRQSSKMPI